MNGLDPGTLNAMTSQRNVSPPGMLPLSVWKNHSCLHDMDSTETKWKGHWETLPLCVFVCLSVMQSLMCMWLSGRCMSDTGAHATLLAEPSSSELSFFTLPVFVFTWSQRNDKGAQTGPGFFVWLVLSCCTNEIFIFLFKKKLVKRDFAFGQKYIWVLVAAHVHIWEAAMEKMSDAHSIYLSLKSMFASRA